jgi:hypothetical protein
MSTITDPGVLWGMQEINAAECHDEKLAQKIQDEFSLRFGSRRIESSYAPLVGLPPLDARPSDEELLVHTRSFDDILIPMLYCGSTPIATSTLEKIFATTTAGYELSHRFLALHLLKKNGCALPEGYDLQAALQTDALQISRELKSAPLDDLYAERAAFLENFGFSELFTETEAETLLKVQQKDGGWRDDRFVPRLSNSHTTILALWALSHKLGICPF